MGQSIVGCSLPGVGHPSKLLCDPLHSTLFGSIKGWKS
jgi:hypothetical protein